MCRIALFAFGWTIVCCNSVSAQSSMVQPIDWQPGRVTPASYSALPSSMQAGGPVAILVRNPGLSPGEPAFALADPTGAIQRLVEPTSGADLESRVGQIVRVKHDSGRTLLSSQLEFVGNHSGVIPAAYENRNSRPRPRPGVRTAQAGSVISEGVIAEEISVPGESQPIWRDEMEMSQSHSQGMSRGSCNCERCRAARGESFAPMDEGSFHGGMSCDCPQCRSRRGGLGWDCCICDAIFGDRRSQHTQCGPNGCNLDGFGDCNYECGAPYGNPGCCDFGGCQGDRWTRVNPGLIGSAEIIFFRAYDSEPDSSQSSKHETAGRFELGHMNETGRSWKVRYFRFDDPNFDGNNSLDLQYLDLIYAGRFTLGCNWRGELEGGVRWARVDDQFDNRYNRAFGPVIGGQLRAPCCLGTDLDWYGIARQSFQYGTEQNSGFYGTFAISEVQLGAEFQRCTCGGTGFARAFIEGQSWQGMEDEDSEDVGLFGFGFAIGLTR